MVSSCQVPLLSCFLSARASLPPLQIFWHFCGKDGKSLRCCHTVQTWPTSLINTKCIYIHLHIFALNYFLDFCLPTNGNGAPLCVDGIGGWSPLSMWHSMEWNSVFHTSTRIQCPYLYMIMCIWYVYIYIYIYMYIYTGISWYIHIHAHTQLHLHIFAHYHPMTGSSNESQDWRYQWIRFNDYHIPQSCVLTFCL